MKMGHMDECFSITHSTRPKLYLITKYLWYLSQAVTHLGKIVSDFDIAS